MYRTIISLRGGTVAVVLQGQAWVRIRGARKAKRAIIEYEDEPYQAKMTSEY